MCDQCRADVVGLRLREESVVMGSDEHPLDAVLVMACALDRADLVLLKMLPAHNKGCS